MKNYQTLLLAILGISIGFTSCKHPSIHQYTFTKTVIEDSVMVVTAHPLATKIGIEVLRDGGNAIDATIAVQFALAACYPVAGNIGGGGFMVYRNASGKSTTLDFREKAPSAAYPDMYLDENDNAISELSQYGELAVGVPGSVDGMIQAYAKYSKLKDWKRLVQPAIEIARKGFHLTGQQAGMLNWKKADFDKYNRAKTPFNNKEKYTKGDLLIQSELALTLEAIRDYGRDGFYSGWVADKIVEQMNRGNGVISKQDLIDYRAVWREPLKTSYRGHEIISMPPPSSGGVALTQLLEMIEPYDIKKLGHHSASSIHLMAEAERRVYADRATHLGDSDYYDVPLEMLMDNEYIKERMIDFEPTQASVSDSIKSGQAKESMETTHFSIVDAEGNTVSLTTTINGAYGAKTVVQGAGFLLNNEMDDFSAKPGVPNMFGLIGAEANKVEPGKRMLSSMTPTIVLKDGKTLLTVGSPGGSKIITSVFQVIVNVIDYGMSATEAVSAPRFHHQWKPDKIEFEEIGFDQKVIDSLKVMGHTVEQKGKIGKIKCIYYNSEGMIEGAADNRGDDTVLGY